MVMFDLAWVMSKDLNDMLWYVSGPLQGLPSLSLVLPKRWGRMLLGWLPRQGRKEPCGQAQGEVSGGQASRGLAHQRDRCVWRQGLGSSPDSLASFSDSGAQFPHLP